MKKELDNSVVNDGLVVEHRISKIKESILIGMTTKEILERFGAKEINGKFNKYYFGVSNRQIDNYIAKAKEQIRESSNFDKTKELGRAIERYDLLFKSAISKSDFKTATIINEKLTNLLGLIQKEKDEKADGTITITRVYS